MTKPLIGGSAQWSPFEAAFLMGTKSSGSSIRRAFGSPMVHPLSERQILRRIFGFLPAYPESLRRFRAPKYWDKSEDDEPLPQFIDDADDGCHYNDHQVLIMYNRKNSGDGDGGGSNYITTEVFYDPETDKYEITTCHFRRSVYDEDLYSGDAETHEYITLSQVLDKLKL